jgi:hypothetical protein
VRRDQLEHIVRASAAILDERQVIVVGSQAILGSFDETQLAPEIVQSVEVDILPLDDPDEEKANLIDGSIGEGSPFQTTHGIYADGVSERTSRLPAGWRTRLVRVENENTNGITGWCLEPHDLVVAKLLANRQKDRSFCRALLRQGIIDSQIVTQRLAMTDADDSERARVAASIAAMVPGSLADGGASGTA